ncbi:hypothetical protein ACLQ24_09295 [Micromonospora sp. DT4]|uniref:thiolase family protein n=1 Tax=Micromonospora sp. DT4 TaxID=3393438 RepID=UPI003CEE4887
MPSEAYVYDAVRTPRGRGRDTGALHGVKPISLVVGLIDALRERNPGLDVARLEDLLLSIVTPIGEQGGDLAGAAALLAGLPDKVGGVQLNRFCASGLEAVDSAAARTETDANIGSIFGIGFPAWTGGVIRYVRQYAGGPAGFAARATELADRYGDRFTPPGDLVDRLASRPTEPVGVA